LVVDDDGFAALGNCAAVTATYSTINAAIGAANSGDTIEVCPGLYNEMVGINKNDLTLNGEQAGVDARTRPFIPDPSTQSIIEHTSGPVQITADNAVLDGFTVQGSAGTDPNFLAGIWMNPGSRAPDVGGAQILNNIIQDNISGIELDSKCTAQPTLVQFNLIQNNNIPGPGSGNGIQTNFGLCNATIDMNRFSGDTSNSVLVLGPPVTAVAFNVKVTNNELVAGTVESISFLGVSSSTISGNVSTGSTSTGTIDLFGGNSGITVTSNTLLNGNRAIVVENPYGVGPNSNISADLNCIAGNLTAGLEVDPLAYPMTPRLDATNNWWGSASGPFEIPRNTSGGGDKIIDLDQNVEFFPWLLAPRGSLCPVPPPPPNTPGKATGGGYIQGTDGGGGGGIGGIQPLDVVVELAEMLILQSSNPQSVNSKANFGFVATCCAPRGNLEYNDHGSNIRIKATSVTNFTITDPSLLCPTGKHAQFRGDAKQTNANGTVVPVTYIVDVDDCDEPGSSPGSGPDTFRIETTGAYMASGPLIGGNIQVHK
jgi:hypothetical protein